jgi:hypothetical protein
MCSALIGAVHFHSWYHFAWFFLLVVMAVVSGVFMLLSRRAKRYLR